MPEFRVHKSLSEIPAAQWDALHDGRNPFVSHAFLSGLERTGCLRAGWGWAPLHAALWEDDELVAAAPGYVKGNSHGEFVFDHAWAAAVERAGRDYYPKWLFAVPYTPVTGPRLLARDDAARTLLCEVAAASAQRLGLSSVHVNFIGEAENTAIPSAWLERTDVQFHWRNDSGWRTFDDYLAALQPKKRKNIRQERRHAREAGIGFRIVHGDEADTADVEDMHALYLRAFSDKGNSPALTQDFFRHLAGAMPRQVLFVLARHGAATIAGALFLRGGETLYGRYWGAFEEIPGLHFETCYYQGIEYCLREGLRVFEPGAQGEHKIARGFLPVIMRSRHHFVERGLDQAFARWCAEERAGTERYRQAILAHSPFREPGDA